MALAAQSRAMASSFLRFFRDHIQRRTTVGRTPLDEWSARRRDLYLTTHNTHNGQTSLPPAGFEPTISAGERPQTYALDRAATGTGNISIYSIQKNAFYTMHITSCWMVEELVRVSETQAIEKFLSVGSVIPLMIMKVITVCREWKYKQ